MKKTKPIVVRETETVKNSFMETCKARGDIPSELLRGFIREYLSDVKAPAVFSSDESRSEIMTTRVKPQELDKIKEILNAENKTRSSFLLGLIRARLNKFPHFNTDEINQLRDSNRQLLAIGRNLNQIVAAINAGRVKDAKLTERYCNDIIARIDSQRKAIDKLIKFNLERDV